MDEFHIKKMIFNVSDLPKIDRTEPTPAELMQKLKRTRCTLSHRIGMALLNQAKSIYVSIEDIELLLDAAAALEQKFEDSEIERIRRKFDEFNRQQMQQQELGKVIDAMNFMNRFEEVNK